jgi:hypothetical protein
MGRHQHFLLGQHLREKYILNSTFLKADYGADEVYVRSTYLNRTYLSSLYQLMGMYPGQFPSLKDYQEYEIGSESYISPI